MTESGFAYADIIVLGLIAGFILLRLRGVLGQDSGVDSQDSANDNSSMKDLRRVFSFPHGKREEEDEEEAVDEVEAVVAPIDKLMDSLDKEVKKGVEDIKKSAPTFDLVQFIDGAKGAFEMVIKAFSDTDKKTLKMLLDKPLAELFIGEAEQAKKADEKKETTLISIENCTPIAASLDGSMARITLSIVSEQVQLVRNKAKEIIDGDPKHIERVEDEWVFERDVHSRQPNWVIVDT